MKKLFFVIAITVGFAHIGLSQTATTSTVVPAAPASKAAISFVTDMHDFGAVPQGTPVSYVFSFKNTGKDPLVLNAVNASCGCTTPEWPKEPIAPGATASIKATYNAANPGTFTKTITVTSNSGTNPSLVLTLKGEVKPAAANATNSPAPASVAAPKKN